MQPHNVPDNLGLLDKREVAEAFGCSTRHLDRLAKDGLIPPPIRIGHLVRWRRTDLLAWLDRNAEGGAE